MASKELIEKVARGFARRWIGSDKWHILSEEGRELYREDARVAISIVIDDLKERAQLTSSNEVTAWLNASALGEQSE